MESRFIFFASFSSRPGFLNAAGNSSTERGRGSANAMKTPRWGSRAWNNAALRTRGRATPLASVGRRENKSEFCIRITALASLLRGPCRLLRMSS